MKKRASAILTCLLWCGYGAILRAQANSGTVRGTVLDPSGAAIVGASVEIQNPVSYYDKTVQTDSQGRFQLDNIPLNNYHLTASVSGFQTGEQDVDVRSPVPIDLKLRLKIGAATTSVTVETAEAL